MILMGKFSTWKKIVIIRDNIGGFIPKIYGGDHPRRNKSLVDTYFILIQQLVVYPSKEMVVDPS